MLPHGQIQLLPWALPIGRLHPSLTPLGHPTATAVFFQASQKPDLSDNAWSGRKAQFSHTRMQHFSVWPYHRNP